MKIYRTKQGCVIEEKDKWLEMPTADWHSLTTREDLADFFKSQLSALTACGPVKPSDLLAPIANQEVWAAGVTYYRSRTARMEESKSAGGGSFYDRVYEAERPELFMKATAPRVVGPGRPVHIRRDSQWNVPEPELTLLAAPSGKLIGYTIGNDMSSRDIEGENPLYLPQAKVYERSCSLGPCILVSSEPLSSETRIAIDILRDGAAAFRDETTLAQLKRTPEELLSYLFRENYFPDGCFLLTGTGIVPPDSFSLQPGDEVRISIDGIGTLENTVD